jgi:hypothetical protein
MDPVTYESLLNAQRTTARKVAIYPEGSTGLNSWSQYGLTAYHHHHAGERRKELFTRWQPSRLVKSRQHRSISRLQRCPAPAGSNGVGKPE